ncbi:MAG: class I SAM-dependent methyltransferase [Desulfobacteraceae bacterium]|nr:class I SAM-dependent methyltransferase [Desulfobacteraceae bacterium]
MKSHVENHYHSDNLSQKIHSALKKSGRDASVLAPKDLSSVDQLHTGGAKATLALTQKTRITKNSLILDAGCGIGGSSRLLAKTFQCQVTGIDLAESFIETAKDLTRWCALDHYINFEQGSVLDMPFKTDTFDAILCQHILMNIQDKQAALKEFYRVLKPGANLIIHEIFQGENKPIALPVPWAGNHEISFLLPWEKFNFLLTTTGFTQDFFSDETKTALAWWQMVDAATKNKNPRPLGPHLVFGSNATFFATNMQNNFQNKTIQCIEAVFKKS